MSLVFFNRIDAISLWSTGLNFEILYFIDYAEYKWLVWLATRCTKTQSSDNDCSSYAKFHTRISKTEDHVRMSIEH